jgi:hypothetical protein
VGLAQKLSQSADGSFDRSIGQAVQTPFAIIRQRIINNPLGVGATNNLRAVFVTRAQPR